MSVLFNELLSNHYQQISKLTLTELFEQDPSRGENLNLQFNGIYFDFSKNNLTEETLNLLLEVAKKSHLTEKTAALFRGEKINNTENRAVLHIALRSKQKTLMVDNHNVMDDINAVKLQMQEFCKQINSGEQCGFTGKKITTIVNIGIGGSDLGPVLICQALRPYRQDGMEIHFASSVDGYMVNDILENLDPETSLFVIASKTFTTEETITNAKTARKWFLAKTNNNEKAIAKHFIALSTNVKAVTEFGIAPQNMFVFWDFVGGRYSSWSAIGLSVALYIGYDNFTSFLDGGYAMDEHFANTPLEKNLPVLLALVGIWYINFYDYRSLTISPYNTRLSRFPAYIQQLEMESNGKSVNKAGEPINYATCPVIWGDSGINGQHAYYQLLHQGSQIIPMDIIIALSDKFSDEEHNDILWSNAIAQAEAFMCGKNYETALNELISGGLDELKAKELARHKVFMGNRPTNMLVLPEISPYYLGMLIALYEHKVFVQGVIWDINSFDQMGVELGKQLAKAVLHDIKSSSISSHDASTTALINHYLTNKKP